MLKCRHLSQTLSYFEWKKWGIKYQVFERKSNWNFHTTVLTHTHTETHLHTRTHTPRFIDSRGLMLDNLYNSYIADKYCRYFSKYSIHFYENFNLIQGIVQIRATTEKLRSRYMPKNLKFETKKGFSLEILMPAILVNVFIEQINLLC